jgi:hypothetical protein
MYSVVEAANLIEDAELSRQAYTLLAPFARLPVITSLGVSCLGSVHHCLGVASLTTGDLDRAVEHLHLAIRGNLALGHWPATVLSRTRLGQALALRGGPGDGEARRELTLATQEAEAMDMPLPGPDKNPRVECRRRGRRWRMEMNGRTALVEDSVGMRHLATLLANPGYEIPAVDLAAGPQPADPATARKGAESHQPVLDEVARREYKQRLTDLEAEIDELESMNDLERIAGVRAERDWLIAELTSATGMGGRHRRFNGSAERARVAVGKAIRRALDRVSEADRAIGDELRATIQTGRLCSYRP